MPDDGSEDMMRGGILKGLHDRIECRRVGPLLQPFLDGALDAPQRRRVIRHLEACRRCGLETATYASLISRLHGIAEVADTDAVARLESFVDALASDDPPPPDPD